MTNFEKIRNEMDTDMVSVLLSNGACDMCIHKDVPNCTAGADLCREGIRAWLMREAENEPVNAEEIEREAAERYGIRSQSIVAIEEMSELQKELTKLLRGECENHIDHISEEMADVYIMLEQLEILLKNRAAIDEWKDKKLRRLRDKLRKDSEE